MKQRIVITVTEHGLGYQEEIPDGLEVEVRDYRPESVRSQIQRGDKLDLDEGGQFYCSHLFPMKGPL